MKMDFTRVYFVYRKIVGKVRPKIPPPPPHSSLTIKGCVKYESDQGSAKNVTG